MHQSDRPSPDCLQELNLAYEQLCDHFFVIAGGEDSMPSMAWVLEKAKAAKIQ
jgi:hypothetical protein